MDTNLKIRNSGVYRLLLFALCVFAFSQLLPSVRTLQHVIVYGELQPRDFFTSPYGMGGRVTDDVQNLAYTYVQEEMAFLNPNFVYEITGKRGRFTNEKQGVDIFATYPYSVKIEGDTVRYGAAFPNDADLYLAAEELPDMSIGWTEDAVHNVRVRYNTIQNELQRSPYMAGLFFVLWIVTGVGSVYATGRRTDGSLKLSPIDTWPTELFLLLFVPLFALFVMAFGDWFQFLHLHWQGRENASYYYVLVLLFAIGFSLFLLLVRKVKARRFRQDLWLFRLFSVFIRYLRGNAENLAHTERNFTLAFRYVIVSALIVLIWQFTGMQALPPLLMLLAAAAVFLFLLRGSLQVSAQSVQNSVEEQVKAERMKVDLVTNVSHDLNTPLTSIIGYVDLLQDEEMSDAAKEYTEVLRQKSLRLKGIVSDLFDLSKSTSGTIELQREVLDYRVLIRQTLSDMQDAVEKSGRVIVCKLPEERVPVYADGMQLYRVLQNLIGNALRYSVEGTRIFLRLELQADTAHLTIKNVSAYPLDFDQEEILSRFVRGDLARTTEGSGLGLAIAKSFTENNEGSFQVFAEEDVFIAMQSLKLCKEDEEV